MNKILTLSALFFFTFNLSAQITINQSDLPAVGDMLVNAGADTTGISAGSAGANQTWDFSSLDTLSIDTTVYITPSDAPNYTDFPTANLASVNSGAYFFFNSTPTALWSIGGTVDIDDTGDFLNIFFDPVSKQMELPATYETSFSDSTNLEFILETQDGNFRTKSVIVSENIVDAYGTVITPVGSFDALRAVSNTNTKDSTWIDLGGGNWFLFSATESDDVTYNFLSEESKGPLVSIDYLEDGTIANVSYWLGIITEPQAPVSQFTFENDGSAIQFTDLSLYDPVSWLWDFGDGNTSTLQNPQHTYATQGDYIVCLTVTNNQGSHTSCETITVLFQPDAAFTFVDNGTGDFDFEDQSSNNPTEWLWDFGDGNTSTVQNPQHHYWTEGSFTVCLTATNDAGSDMVCNDLTVVYPPVAAFSYTDEGGAIVTFEDQSAFNPTEWLWDFGDGNTSTEQNPQHQYTGNPPYTVCLTATNAGGSNTTCQSVDFIILGVNDNEAKYNVQIAPNPSTDLITVSVEHSTETLQLKVTDALGKLIYENEFTQQTSFNVKDWPEGVYFYQVTERESNSFVSGRLMVVR